MGSPECDALDEEDLMTYFVLRVADEVYAQGLDLSGWEDAFLHQGVAMNTSSFPNDNVYAYAWNNMFEIGGGERAYVLANAGYKVARHTI